jgi:hypothetical protein
MNAANPSFIICSSVVGPPNLPQGFRDLEVPIVVLGQGLYANMGMTGPEPRVDFSKEVGHTRLEIVNPEHSMAAGLSGVVEVADERPHAREETSCQMIWARPRFTALKIASLAPRLPEEDEPARTETREQAQQRREQVVLFGYEAGAELADGRRAPARRVGLFFDRELAARLNNYGWALFDAAVNWAMGEELKQFPEVFREEWQEIRERRQRHGLDACAVGSVTGTGDGRPRAGSIIGTGSISGTGSGGTGNGAGGNGTGGGAHGAAAEPRVEEESAPDNLVGLALSGGGIRSAIFCLGLLQGLHGNGLLRIFDYLSTVSGGGYLGGWWSAWLARYGQYSQARGGYPQFAVYDIERPGDLAAKFLTEQNEVSSRVRAYFEKTQPGFLEEFCRKRAMMAADRKEFVNHLNNLIGEAGSLLNEHAEANLARPEGAPQSSGNGDNGRGDAGEAARFNRGVLERAYKGEIRRGVFPPPEKIEPVRSRDYFAGGDGLESGAVNDQRRVEKRAESAKDIMCAGDDPTHHLRLFANYLTPRKGTFSKDTWRAITTVSRNLVLTWLTLIPLLIAFVLAGHLYFAAAPPAKGTKEVVGDIENRLYQRRWAEASSTEREAATRELSKQTGISEEDLKAISHYTHDFVYPYGHVLSTLRKKGPELPNKPAENLLQIKAAELLAGATEVEERTRELDGMAKVFAAAGDTEQEQALRKQADLQVAQAAAMRGRSEDLNRLATEDADTLERQMKVDLRERAWWAFYPLALLLSLMVAVTSAWMLSNTSGSKALGWAGGITFWLLIVCWLAAFVQKSENAFFKLPALFFDGVRSGGKFGDFLNAWNDSPSNWVLLAGWVIAVALLLAWAWWGARREKGDGLTIDEDAETKEQWERDVQRTRATQVHTKLLIWLVVLAAVFLLSGFAHELYLYAYHSGGAWVARAGAFTVLSTIVGALFTAVKASPIGGGDEKETKRPSLVSRAVFALTPPFVLAVLAVLISGLSHYVLCYIMSDAGSRIPPLAVAIFITALLCMILAVYEMRWRTEKSVKWRLFTATALGLVWGGFVFGAYFLIVLKSTANVARISPLAFAALVVCFFVPRLIVDESKGRSDSRQRSFRVIILKSLSLRREFTWRQVLATSAALALGGSLLLWLVPSLYEAFVSAKSPWAVSEKSFWPALSSMATALICVVLVAFEIWRGTGGNRRPLWLLTGVAAAMLAVLFFSLSGSGGQQNVLLAQAVVGLLALSLGLVIALGWLADPNALSMHQFYRDRLVRAYLGASNVVRRERQKHVTESVEGDDLMLWQLKSCQRGAPYHLINTTLNLAAGRDITTVQRSSAMFVLSKRNCGSTRTGYRSTRRYMGGRLSLGTAVAVSGAAASPNMGSRTPSSSLAMLMTLLNVRLGFWAPTPNKDHWRSRQSQLWPFYMLREFLSQTNELSAYSYLTDGGHFDNTGLYSLVERGCRFIVAADCGADPQPCFADLGDAIRRCRIDFNAEIEVDVTPLMKNGEKGPAAHFVVGQITYSREHAESLRWRDTSSCARRGIIVIFKPAPVGDETADVRQYSLENSNFPQQTTADQWFDEAQFESYRRLGLSCADAAFGSLEATEELKRKDKSFEPFSLADIERLFEELRSDPSAKKSASEMAGYIQSRFRSALEEEMDEHGLRMTKVCAARVRQLVANGAGVLAEMKATPTYIDDAEASLRTFVQELDKLMLEHREAAAAAAGQNGAMGEITPKTFKKALAGLKFPFR